MSRIREILAPANQWVPPFPPLLDEEFDDENNRVESLGIPAYDHKNEKTNH